MEAQVIQTSVQTVASIAVPPSATAAATNWQNALPVIIAGGVTLRELRLTDAPTLLAMLNTEEVSRFISPPPSSVSGFERFILWTQRERSAGRFACFGIVPQGHEHAIGIIQVRALAPGFDVAEWGFAIGSSFWGRGVFPVAARAVMAFAFETLRAHRLEARSTVDNGRGNGALQKIGASREGVLRKSFRRDGVYHDQVIWSICAEDWRQWQCLPTRISH
jgi:ribosomal-protein-alanine N-acetyltransferase